MSRRFCAALGLVVVVTGAVFARSGSSGALPVLKVPLPGLQQAQIRVVTVSATASAGKTVGRVTVRTMNEAQLGNLGALYIVKTPSKASAHESIKVYVLMRRFGTLRSVAAGGTGMDVQITVENAQGSVTLSPSAADACVDLDFYEVLFESGAGVVNTQGATWTLSSARSQTAQPSPPESVLDDLISSLAAQRKPQKCPGTFEQYDPGNK